MTASTTSAPGSILVPENTTPAAPVQGPAQPTHTDLIWATASSAAALEDPTLSPASRQPYLEAEAAVYNAAAHLGVDQASPEAYAAELAESDQASMAMEASPDAPALAEWASVTEPSEPEAGL